MTEKSLPRKLSAELLGTATLARTDAYVEVEGVRS